MMENENRTLGQPVHEKGWRIRIVYWGNQFTKKGGRIGYFGNEKEAYALY
jgi:hypothetical protein